MCPRLGAVSGGVLTLFFPMPPFVVEDSYYPFISRDFSVSSLLPDNQQAKARFYACLSFSNSLTSRFVPTYASPVMVLCVVSGAPRCLPTIYHMRCAPHSNTGTVPGSKTTQQLPRRLANLFFLSAGSLALGIELCGNYVTSYRLDQPRGKSDPSRVY